MSETSKVESTFLPDSHTRLSMAVLMSMLYSRRLLLLVSSLGSALLLFVLSLLIRNTYKATALVMPPDRSNSTLSMLSSTGLQAGALAGLNVKNSGDLYVALMQSPTVQDSVISRFHLQSLYKTRYASQARSVLENRSVIVADPKSGIISVSVVDTDPARAAALANGTVEAFEHLSSQLAITDAARRRLFFERQILQTRSDLGRAEDALQSTSARTGILEPQGSTHSLIGFESQLRAQVAAKRVQLQSLLTYDSDQNRDVQVARRELQSLQGQLDVLDQKTTGSGMSKAAESSATLEYERKLRDVRYNEAVFELLMKNLEAARLDEAREGSAIQVVSMATTPDIKDGPHRSFFLIGGGLLGFLGSTIWLLLRQTLAGYSRQRYA